MGCGASTGQPDSTGTAVLASGAAQPLNEATATSDQASATSDQAIATSDQATATSDQATASSASVTAKTLPAPFTSGKPDSFKVSTSARLEVVEKLGELELERDSPTTVRVGTKKPSSAQDDGIVTVWDAEDDDGKRSVKVASQKEDAEADAAAMAVAIAAADAADQAEEDERASTYLPRGQKPLESEVEQLKDDPLSKDGGTWSARRSPDVDPDAKVELSQSFLNEIEPCPAGPASRYETLTLSEDDSDDDGGSGSSFDLLRWKRFYHWNKKKHGDLLKFLWKSFDPKKFSIHCVSYRLQDQIFAAYQGDNLLTGFIHRLHAAGVKCFGVMHTLYNYDTTAYKVVGMFIFEGQTPPQALQGMPDYEDYLFSKATVSDPIIKNFVGALLTSQSPVPALNLVASREIML